MTIENQKLIERVPVMDGEGKRAFDLVRTEKGIFIEVKCHSAKSRYKKIRICLSDAAYQILKTMTTEERQSLRTELEKRSA